jgi:hypothetical protein
MYFPTVVILETGHKTLTERTWYVHMYCYLYRIDSSRACFIYSLFVVEDMSVLVLVKLNKLCIYKLLYIKMRWLSHLFFPLYSFCVDEYSTFKSYLALCTFSFFFYINCDIEIFNKLMKKFKKYRNIWEEYIWQM